MVGHDVPMVTRFVDLWFDVFFGWRLLPMDGTLTKADGPIRLLKLTILTSNFGRFWKKDVNWMTFWIDLFVFLIDRQRMLNDNLLNFSRGVIQVASFDAKTSAVSEAQDVDEMTETPWEFTSVTYWNFTKYHETHHFARLRCGGEEINFLHKQWTCRELSESFELYWVLDSLVERRARRKIKMPSKMENAFSKKSYSQLMASNSVHIFRGFSSSWDSNLRSGRQLQPLLGIPGL